MSGDFRGDLANLWAVGGGQAPSKSKQAHRGYYRYCPECGWQLTGKFSTCPRCGADLKLKRCPYCRGEVPLRFVQCPRCTGPLDWCGLLNLDYSGILITFFEEASYILYIL